MMNNSNSSVMAKINLSRVFSGQPMPEIKALDDVCVVRVDDACGLHFWRYVPAFAGSWSYAGVFSSDYEAAIGRCLGSLRGLSVRDIDPLAY